MPDKIDNIKQFPKNKRDTPEDETEPIFHECFDKHLSFKWLIHLKGDGLCIVCSDCGYSTKLPEFINHILGESNGI